MKTLDFNQMENIKGDGTLRDCAAMGVLTLMSLPASIFTYGMATIGTVTAAIAMGCFNEE